LHPARKIVRRVTHGDRGGGSRLRLPPPRQPLPHGGDSPSMHGHARRSFLCRQCEDTAEDPVLSPRARNPTIAMHCPPPPEGAGGGRGAAGRWGCFYEYRSTRDAGDRGGRPSGGDGCLSPGKDAIPELCRYGRETLFPLLRGLIFSVPAAWRKVGV